MRESERDECDIELMRLTEVSERERRKPFYRFFTIMTLFRMYRHCFLSLLGSYLAIMIKFKTTDLDILKVSINISNKYFTISTNWAWKFSGQKIEWARERKIQFQPFWWTFFYRKGKFFFLKITRQIELIGAQDKN